MINQRINEKKKRKLIDHYNIVDKNINDMKRQYEKKNYV